MPIMLPSPRARITSMINLVPESTSNANGQMSLPEKKSLETLVNEFKEAKRKRDNQKMEEKIILRSMAQAIEKNNKILEENLRKIKSMKPTL